MIPLVSFRSGDEHTLALEYVQMNKANLLTFKCADLSNPGMLHADNILAVHYADGGAQGDAGAVEILYYTQKDVQILYGNYAYGNLNLDAVIILLPMLKSLDSRYCFEPPYPFGGKLDIPVGWKYLYMGAMNHFFVRQEIAERTGEFIKTVIDETGGWEAFNAIAWFCGASNVKD